VKQKDELEFLLSVYKLFLNSRITRFNVFVLIFFYTSSNITYDANN